MTHSMITNSRRRPRDYTPLIVLAALVTLLFVLVPAARKPVRFARLLVAPVPDSLPVPVAGVRASRLSDTWGAPRGNGRSHEGIDIFARRNTPIRSTTEGVIVSTANNRLGGKVVVVLGPGGHRHYYAHLEQRGRYVNGDWVRAGDTIGFVGNTGNARTTPPHLHYGIYTPSGPINPYPLLIKGAPRAIDKPRPKRSASTTRTARRHARSRSERSSR